MVKNAAGKMVEKPQYGGVFVGGLHVPILGFDDVHTHWGGCYATRHTNEELITGDWAKGSQGTGEAGFLIRGTLFIELSVGELAESWEILDDSTAVFNIRQGVSWHNKPPTNGRELSADDVALAAA